MSRFQKHVFVCENLRAEGDERGSCARKGSAEIRQALKKAVKTNGLRDTSGSSVIRVRANAAGCLDACEFGPSIVVYPEAIWYGGVSLTDVDEIVKSHLIEGKPVERLRIRDPKYKKDLK